MKRKRNTICPVDVDVDVDANSDQSDEEQYSPDRRFVPDDIVEGEDDILLQDLYQLSQNPDEVPVPYASSQIVEEELSPMEFFVLVVKYIKRIDNTGHVTFEKIEKALNGYMRILHDMYNPTADRSIWLHVAGLALAMGVWQSRGEVFDVQYCCLDMRKIKKEDVQIWNENFRQVAGAITAKARELASAEDNIAVIEYMMTVCVETVDRFCTHLDSLFIAPWNDRIASFISDPTLFETVKSKHLYRDFPGDQVSKRFLVGVAEKLLHHNARVLEENIHVPIKHEQYNTRAFTQAASIEQYIRSMYSMTHAVELTDCVVNNRNCLLSAVDYVKTQIEPLYFPRLCVNRTAWSFEDGIYDGVKDIFYKYDSLDIPDSLVTANFIKQPIISEMFDMNTGHSLYGHDFMRIPTPNIDRILHRQMCQNEKRPTGEETERLIIFWALIGRLFRNLNETDQWQVCPFIIGAGGTGKSLLMQLIRAVYPPGQTGTVQSDIQETFGLESLVNRLILTVVEVSGKKGLNQQIFQSMVTSEIVEVNKKHKLTLSIPNWLVPMVWCMNVLPAWVDNSNSLGRRIIPFEWRNPPAHVDNDLPKLIEKELARFIVKANKAYLHIRARIKPGMGFHDILPPCLNEAIVELTSRFNPLAAFFADESEVVYEDDAVLNKADLETRIKLYMQNRRGIRSFDTSDVDKSILSYTNQRVTREVRSTVVNGRNRKTIVFVGMRLV